MKNYFTSDWHLGDTRMDILFRPFKKVDDNWDCIRHNFLNSEFNDNDTLWHLGDVIILKSYIEDLKKLKSYYPKSKWNLILGNHDYLHINELTEVFDNIYEDITINVKRKLFYLNHYPTLINTQFEFGLTGHIHHCWKVKRNMINVGVDVWNFKIVSEDEILRLHNAIINYYDKEVFVNEN